MDIIFLTDLKLISLNSIDCDVLEHYYISVIVSVYCFIHSFIHYVCPKHSPYKNCAKYAQIIYINIFKNTVLYTVQYVELGICDILSYMITLCNNCSKTKGGV